MTKIAACLIVRDAEQTLEACLASIRPFVDGVFVYDTGSTDGTLALIEALNSRTHILRCKGCGDVSYSDAAAPLYMHECPAGKTRPEALADPQPLKEGERNPFGEPEDFDIGPLAPITVEQGEWRDDFAWAREQSFALPPAAYDWLLWLDDDDTIEGAQHLRRLAFDAPADCDGYIFEYDYARDEHGNCVCVLWRERLLRRSAGYRWVSPVHEVLLPPEGNPPALARIPAELVRYVHNRPVDRYAPDRNLKILLAEKERREAEGESVDPRTLAYLGTELMARGQFGDAVGYLQQYLDRPDTRWPDERAQVHHKLGNCLTVLGNPTAAVEVEMQALRERDDWPENLIGLAAAFAAIGNWPRAEWWARLAVARTEQNMAAYGSPLPASPLILNPLEHALIPWILIADACVHMERFDDAREAVQRAAQVAPLPSVVEKAREIEAAAETAEIVGAVLMLREVLIRHDENLKAWHLLQTVPYPVANHPKIMEARIAQRENVLHALQPDEYERWYRDEPKESTVPDDVVETIGDYIPRAAFLLEALGEQEAELGRKPVVLDLGCNDFWLSSYLWKQAGIRCDGVELNRASYEKGLARKERFGTAGEIFHGNLHDAPAITNRTYDAVVLFEVLEHVPDVDETLTLLESMVGPKGRVYLTTPNGAFEGGRIDGWAKVERKGHLRAIPATDLADTLIQRGEVRDFRVHDFDRLTFAAYEPKRRVGSVSFFAGASWEPWSPASLRQGGIGGSETALVQVATRLAQVGYEVRVYSGAEPGFYGGALYRPFTAWDPAEEVDLLVSSRRPDVFDLPIRAKRTALWCHDHSYPGMLTEERAEKIDSVVVLSEWERDRFERLYPFLADKLTIIRNGITVREWDGTPRYPDADRGFDERKPRVVYSSSADRGLDVLLEVWPRIREQVPNAELHVFYGWETFDRVAQTNPNLWALKTQILGLAKDAGGEEGGVFFRGRVGQVELAAEMQQARLLAYPTAFLETSCITAMEAQAAGLPIVTSRLGALAETGASQEPIKWSADEDEPHNRTDEYKGAFVGRVVALMSRRDTWTYWHKQALGHTVPDSTDRVRGYDWSERIPEWEALLAPPPVAHPKREKVAA